MSDDRRLVSRSAPKPPKTGGLPDDGIVRVGCQRRRAGTMTLIYGLAPAELGTIAAELRRRCGTGGTAKDGVVALQGDKRDDVLAYFAERGRRTKRMGG